MIDSIHDTRSKLKDKAFEEIHDKFMQWVSTDYIPIHQEYLLNIALLDREHGKRVKKQKEGLDPKMYQTPQERCDELQKLMDKYEIKLTTMPV